MHRFFLLVASLLALSACKQQDSLSQHGIVYCAESAPQFLNPQLSASRVVADSSNTQLYDKLVAVDARTHRLRGSLATHWWISNDGLTYRFKLRPGVSFHQTAYFTPTRPLNAEDVVFSFERLLKPSHPYHFVNGADYALASSLNFQLNVREVRALDPQTVEIELTNPNSSFIATLAADFAVVTSKQYGEQLLEQGTPERFDSQPIGSGPYRFSRYLHGTQLRFIAHERYWQGMPKLRDLVYEITPNPSHRLAKILTQQCDLMDYPAATQLAVIADKEGLQVAQNTGLNVSYLAFNTKKAPLNQLAVRRALAQAINRQQIINAVYLNTGLLANSVLPPISWAYNASLPDVNYDPKAARQALEDLGVLPLELTVWVEPQGRSYNPSAIKMAELLQADFAQVGVKLNIQHLDNHHMFNQLASGQHDLALLGWLASSEDPDNFLRAISSCSAIPSGLNASRWCSPSFDAQLNQALLSRGRISRIRDYHRAQSILAEQMPILPIAHALNLHVYRQELRNIAFTPFGNIVFQEAYKELAP